MQAGNDVAQGRRPKNIAEGEFFDLAAERGFLLTKRGWPDFFLEINGRVACVEVKPSNSRTLKGEQRRVMHALCAVGLPCFVWSPDGGLRRVVLGVRGLEVEDSVGTASEQLSSLVKQLVDEGGSGGGGPSPAPAEDQAASPSRSETSQAIDAVWAAYVRVMSPRRKEPGGDDRTIIRSALQVASPQELVVCIETCNASDYHMKRGRYEGRDGGKYNSLGKILKPRPRRGETQRSRIDWWLDRANAAGVAGFPSADDAIVGQRQVEVQRGHQSGDPEMVRKAQEAEAWLGEHGIETVRREDGYPTFRRTGKGDTA